MENKDPGDDLFDRLNVSKSPNSSSYNCYLRIDSNQGDTN